MINSKAIRAGNTGLNRLAPLLTVLVLTAAPGAADAHGPIGAVGDALCSASGRTGTTLGSTTCVLRATEIIYVTNWSPTPGRPPVKRVEMLSLVNVPTPLDVDDRIGADLIATMRALGPGKVSLEIVRTATANPTLPVSVVVHANDPSDSSLRYVFGYDALASTAPGRVTETFSPRAEGLGVSVSTSAPGASLALLGARIESKANAITNERQESLQEARATFSTVPASIDADLSNSGQSGTTTTEVKLTVNRKTTVSVDFADEKVMIDAAGKRKGAHTDLAGTLAQVDAASLPTRSLTVKLMQDPVLRAEPAGTKRAEVVTTTAGTRVAQGRVSLTEHPAEDLSKVKSKIDARFENLPSSSTITVSPRQQEDNATSPPTPPQPQVIKVATEPGQSFDLVDVARAENGEPQRLSDDQYAYVVNDAAQGFSSAGARVRGLKETTVRILEDELVDVDAKLDLSGGPAGGRPFKVLAEDEPNKAVEADISNLPSTVAFTLRPKSTPTVQYRGSGEINSTTIRAHDEAGLAKSEKPFPKPFPGQVVQVAKDLEVVAQGVPTDLTATLAADAKTITLEATDAKPGQTTPGNPDDIGKLDVRLSTGALTGDDKSFVDGLGTTKDGALVRDRLDRYVIFARVSSLHRATLELDPEQEPLRVNLAHGSTYTTPRPFHAAVEQQVVGDVQLDVNTGALVPQPSTSSTDADVQDLPQEIDLELREKTTPTIDYTGSDEIGVANVRVHDDNGVVKSSKTGLVAQDLVATLTGVPTRLIASFTGQSGGSATIDVTAQDATTNQPDKIDEVEAQLWTRPAGTSGDALPDARDRKFVTDLGTSDGALVADLPDRYVVFARVAKLERAHLELSQELVKIDPLSHTAGPFHAFVLEQATQSAPKTSTDAQIKDLPGKVQLTLRPESTPTVEYTGSAKVGQVSVRVHDEAGVAEGDRTGIPADDLLVRIDDLPTGVTASLDPAGKNISLDARDATNCTNPADRRTCNLAEIGKLEVQLWTRPPNAADDKLPVAADQAFVDKLAQTGSDGVLLRDVTAGPARYAVFARLSGLMAANVILEKTSPDVTLESGSRRDLALDIDNRSMPDCKDGEDNDGDGKIDAPADPECTSRFDDSETSTPSSRPNEQILATIKNRPKCLRFALGKQRIAPSSCSSSLGTLQLPSAGAGATTVLFEGGSGTGAAQTTDRIDVSAKGIRDLQGKELMLRLEGIPGRLEAILIGADVIDVGMLPANDDLDLLEVRLRSGRVDASDELVSTLDGVLVRDKLNPDGTVDRHALFARLSGLRKAHVARAAAGPILDVQLDAGANREFKVDTERDFATSTPTGIKISTTFLRATLTTLKPGTSLKFSDVAGEQQIEHSADASAQKLEIDTNLTGGPMHADVAPIPTSLKLCLRGSGPACNLQLSGIPFPTGPTVVFGAGSPVTINYTDCLLNPQGTACTRAVTLTNLTLDRLSFQFTTHPNSKKPFLFADSDRVSVSGAIRVQLPPGGEVAFVKADLPNGFWADERQVQIGKAITGVPTQDVVTGNINCPSGTDIAAIAPTFFGSVAVGLTGPICDNP